MIVQLHVSQVCAASDEEFYSVWKVLTYMIHMMLDYIQCTIESGRNNMCFNSYMMSISAMLYIYHKNQLVNVSTSS